MDKMFAASCFSLGIVTVSLALVAGSVVKTPPDPPVNCPADYRRRVETCIMDAQMAPQAGGGVSLIVNKDKIVDLCHGGLMMKTIDCLKEIHARCTSNDTVLHELDRLYSVSNWQQATELLCRHLPLFQTNFECLSQSANSVMTCILIRTHTFRMLMAFTDPENHAKRSEVTCNFAEGIVKCLRGPLWNQCSEELSRTVSETMFLLLPPFCHDDNYITHTPHPTPMPTGHTSSTSTPSSSSSSLPTTLESELSEDSQM